MLAEFFDYFIANNRYMCFIGLLVFLGLAFLLSNNKKKINLRGVLGALVMQFLIALFALNTGIGQRILEIFSAGFKKLYSFSDEGIKFIFGNLIDANGPWGPIFVVKVIPIIIFFGAFMSLLYHLGVIQFIVKIIAFVIRPILGTSGAETLCAVGKSMLGPTEAPLLIKKYLNNMTESEMFVVMVSGMGSLSASIIAVYSSMGVSMIHLLTASFMAIPGAILISKILIPETEKAETAAGSTFEMNSDSTNFLDAIASGTSDGLKLAANVAAMLIAFISLMAMVDYVLLYFTGINLNFLFSKLFFVVAYLLGITKDDAGVAGVLLGQKLVINEFIAYASLVGSQIALRSKEILTYALCGFSNISVIGIMIGGISVLAPKQRGLIARLGWKALLGGTLVNLINAAIAGLLL